MPSIPQSLLWISLVVLWLFVLVPMLASKRDAVRRTSDVALATRVLNSAAGARLMRRRGPAAGHRSDPHWRPQDSADADDDDADDDDDGPAPPDSDDVNVVEHDEAEPVAEEHTASAELASDETEFDDAPAEFDDVDTGDSEEIGARYEYVEDTSGIEVAADPATAATPVARYRYESKTAAAVSARKYRFRKRMLMTMALGMLASAAVAYLATPSAWWVCGGVGGLMLLYLAYLRRQTRIEQRLRRRRMQRMARSRLGVGNAHDRERDLVPARLRRPGAVVLEIDDEDPIFEHLDYAPFSRHYDLPRAAGQ
ncbi:FUSC family protein [Mycobacterium heckeshornense]|uniref:Uncharacterized protein n=1 Tax=Mycobacterium heckeshornense TaxID=110505 RepID=A0A2G8B9T5_9MYCO|nr:gephyrin-like molybdotransferase receptor GlpR [Mycobacterium heckeshornense]KMV23828.1 membrane protein [Mycobacterium heckeshornense]MCV7033343.1 FUSC family protein [Mycobacterium heckeshornense]PIJ34426.1 FUSC family protein [Mycobacterium heckeshornense]BCO34635.1 hypothetical protein MHEC_10680 [Mycobacterium heckeshornense]